MLGRVYQEVKMMTLPENKYQKKIRRGRRKEKTFLTQVQVRKLCQLIEGMQYFLCERWCRDFIFMGIVISSFFYINIFNFHRVKSFINWLERVKIWIKFNFFSLVLFIFKMWSSWISCECQNVTWLSSTQGFFLADSAHWWSGRAG